MDLVSSYSLVATPRGRLARERGIWNWIWGAERAVSLLALVALSPLLLSVGVTVLVLSRRSPLVAHLRVGRFGVPFWTLKFRTMWDGARGAAGPWPIEYVVDEWAAVSKSAGDPRVTSRFARFCRRYSIDELPQLLNVVRGEMSLVGPRPLIEHELAAYYGRDAAEVLLEKPGITGLWQVMGRSRLSYNQRRRLDLYLARNRSVRLYLSILWRTAPVVLGGHDGW
jgi:lipopolysaccharide/colanic/teichoic acid biosynthesis glycosyltransferase